MDSDQERKKWDQYYATLHQDSEDACIQEFRGEFVDIVAGLLPEGGQILEAGCGAGEQSLALAQVGTYEIGLMDFSTEAIERARQSFARSGNKAQFSVQDVFQEGMPEFDLVFNAGVLEHYAFDDQVNFLRGMASRSKNFVLVLVPNFQNYWYWLWRIQKSSQGLWPFGKEIPAFDLSAVFDAAGINYHGSAYLGASWTESFIAGVDGISQDLKNMMLEIHRSGLLPDMQTRYLLAALGSVIDVPAPKAWPGIVQPTTPSGGPNLETVSSALADALAIKVGEERDVQQLRLEFKAQISALSAQIEQLQQTHVTDLVERVREIEVQSAEAVEKKIQQIERDHENRFSQRLQEVTQQNAKALSERVQTIEQQSADDVAKKIHQLEQAKATTLLEKLHEIEEQLNQDLAERLRDFELQRDIDQMGVIRQIEHDHTGVLVGKIREIEHLRGQIDALGSPPTPNLRLLIRSYLARMYHKSRDILKRVRHIFQKKVPQAMGTAEVSYQRPITLGHPLIPAERRIVLLSYTFFDFDGNNMYYGGAERYVLELANVLQGLGYYPELYQCGNGYWVRYYGGLRVTGIDVGGDANRLAEAFQKFEPIQALTIFSPFSLALNVAGGPALGISHGVFWDYAEIQANPMAMQAVFSAGKYLDAIVSVDTNTINAMRASAAALAEKFVYVPNFVDVDAFDAYPDRDDEKIVVLYPRRLYRPRGFWLVADVVAEILESYPQVEFHFVGKADQAEETHIKTWMVQYPDRIQWYWLPPDEMPRAYHQADITIIPTIHSEGTSLSCLEALACGNAVIATNVGGLPNLILSEFNGLLIDVSPEALLQALKTLIEDKEVRQNYARRGREVALSFSIDGWRRQWKNILQRYLAVQEDDNLVNQKAAFFPSAPGIPWVGIKQRPHHLASQLANAGIETFWQDNIQRGTSPQPLLHILSPDDDMEIRRPLVFVYYPFTYRSLQHYDNPVVVYDVLDDISIHAASDRRLPEGRRAVDYHRKLLEEADLVMTSSTVLYQQIQPVRSDVILVPNGIDLEHFSLSKKQAEIKSAALIGFHGAIAEWLDVDLFYEVARLRPNYQFELVGPISIDLARLNQLPNVVCREAVDYEQIPAVISRFDVGILPFKLNKLTHAVRPLKVLEYLALGIPVVATPLEELRDWPGVVRAQTPNAFVSALGDALRDREAILDDERVKAFVAEADWRQTVKPLLEWIRYKS